MSDKKLTYEEALQELQTIMQALQEESVSVDELTEKSQRATELIHFCKEKLRATESSIEMLFKKE